MELLKTGLWNGGQRSRCAKIVEKNGRLTYVLDFLAALPALYAEPAGIILRLR